MRKLAFLLVAVLAVGACDKTEGDDILEPVPPTSKPLGSPPDYGPTVRAATPPPPISGGTLHVTKDGAFAVVADPERDRLSIVELATRAVRHVPFGAQAEPGRIVEDEAGRVHVALRRAGAVATVRLSDGVVEAKRPVCPAPRGIALDPASKQFVVVCVGGEVVDLPLDVAQAAKLRVRMVPDLRDVVVTPTKTFVSTFRAAQVYELTPGASDPLPSPLPMAMFKTPLGPMTASVGWRMRPFEGGAVLVHQIALDPGMPVSTGPGGYGGGDQKDCTGSIVQSQLSVVGGAGSRFFSPIPAAVLPVDVAASSSELVLVAAGNAKNRDTPQLIRVRTSGSSAFCEKGLPMAAPPGQAVAVAFGGERWFVQTREPAAIHVYEADVTKAPATISLASDSFADTGHVIFHANSGNFLACASCHPEGGDDGRTWNFADLGPRRTQSFRGGFLKTAPFHWDGDMRDLRALTDSVLTGRMSGPKLDAGQLDALGAWLDAVPALPTPTVTKGSVDAGATLFADRGCAKCHAGAATTTNANVDVGTGGAFQVPSLRGVFYRAPYMHTGCVQTLADRFTAGCAGGDLHGKTSGLSATQIDDLVAYLSTR
ncbi:MAG: c-type cytochrome [Myxococcales bacterium]|nr:c-type cytochrome [Myxococcales bacterium]